MVYDLCLIKPSIERLAQAAKKAQRTSKHLDKARAELHYKAVQLRAQETMLKQAQLNKLYENIEKDLNRNLTKQRELEALETRLREQEVHIAQLQLQSLECASESEANAKAKEALSQREHELDIRQAEMVVMGERLAMQELHLATVERQVDQLEREVQSERERWMRLREEEAAAWRAQKESEAMALEKARDELRQFEQTRHDHLRQLELHLRKIELDQAKSKECVDMQLVALQAQETLLQERQSQVNLQYEDVAAREGRLIALRDEWVAAQDDHTKAANALQLELKARERRLQIFASDAEAQVEVTAMKQKALDVKLRELALREQTLGAKQ
ncbi:hypothetical protein H310_09772 [Aphanomyces invadans]|uniref:Uncharacterized protein n=1 Tax=Aphanomyces invadans TaxID=157072 RepID=A0A024TUD4_9STRA|nr:hypothetical protein H310_09772 [Aphanomyces invadans]ETV96907.1 hypothetical protein H310_09772 [Aphanomyces invadans]|eukprot:XP_008874153.1 hypothetical protein H310_09772 [Aphanomyces invadans]